MKKTSLTDRPCTGVKESKDVFADLKHAFEQAVEYAVENGMLKAGLKEGEMRRSELLRAVANEASRRLNDRNAPYQDGVANVFTGRKKYQEY